MVVWVVLVYLLYSAVNYSQQSSSATQVVSTPMKDDQCPPWEFRNIPTGRCQCRLTLDHLVICKEKPHDLQLYVCFCMAYSHEMNVLLVGSCQYTCYRSSSGYFFPITINSTSQLNEFMCSEYNRQGQLCGSCMPGYAPPVYSYYLSCVNCTTGNWGKYTAVSLLPLTAFFVFVVTFRLSATSPKLNGFILCVQILMSPPNTRAFQNSIEKQMRTHHQLTDAYLFWGTFYGVWNLDFLRLVYTPFCLQPHTNTLHVLALDYLVAVYPLLLITLSYLLVLLYDRNVRLIVCLWKPFLPLFIKFRRQWNIRNSLVEVFATFLLLSYVKILSVSVDLLVPVLLYEEQERIISQPYLFIQGDLPFLGSQHLPYACLALFFLLTFTLLPMLLLFLYPCSCFQACLNRTGCSCQPLHTFMDTFQGHYKNGTNATRDLRFFSGLYLLLRVVVYASTVVTHQIASYAYTTVIIAILAVGVALARPYKKHIYNIIDASFLTITSLLYVTLIPLSFRHPSAIGSGLVYINIPLFLVPVIYIAMISVCWLKPLQLISQCCCTLRRKLRRREQSLTNMEVNRDDYESLHSH